MSKLEEDLKVSSVEVEKIKVEADAQATIVGAEKEKVDAQASIAAVESAKCAVIAEQVDAKMKSVQADLDQALPLVAKAEAEAARCASRLDLANRLVNALGSESERWNNAIV